MAERQVPPIKSSVFTSSGGKKRNAHRGAIQQLTSSVTRSAAKPAIPQVVDKFGVPDGI
jgi:hypothetical protein